MEKQTPVVFIVGPMSSGVRILRRVIEESGLHCVVDTSHGSEPIVFDRPFRVVVIRRDRQATDASREAAWTGHEDYVSFEASDAGIAESYGDVPVFWYEDLCDDTERFIRELALFLDVEPWTVGFDLVNQNDKWFSGVGGPQLGAGTPGNPGDDHGQT